MFKPGDIARGNVSGSIYHDDACTNGLICYTLLVQGEKLSPHYCNKRSGTVRARDWIVDKIGQNYKEKSNG